MDENLTFIKVISIIADFITIVGIITAVRFAIMKKNENVIAFRISRFIHYLLRTAIIIIVLYIIYEIVEVIYYLIITSFKGDLYETKYWEKGKEFQHLISYFVSYSIGLSIAWITCSFIWTSSWNQAKEFINLFLTKNKVLLKEVSTLEIIQATYGSKQKQIDVTQILRKMVANNKLTIKASNNIAGDPHINIVKNLSIKYRIGQKSKNVSILEGQTYTIENE